MPLDDRLKPCPFCGGRASIRDVVVVDIHDRRRDESHVRCAACRVELKALTRDNAIANWNFRKSEEG